MNDMSGFAASRDWATAIAAGGDAVDPAAVDALLAIIAAHTGLERSALVPSATIESLGIASLDMIDILFAVEERFGIYVPMGEELGSVVHLRDLVALLVAQAAAGGEQGTAR